MNNNNAKILLTSLIRRTDKKYSDSYEDSFRESIFDLFVDTIRNERNFQVVKLLFEEFYKYFPAKLPDLIQYAQECFSDSSTFPKGAAHSNQPSTGFCPNCGKLFYEGPLLSY